MFIEALNLWELKEVWKRVCSMWKPVLSAANGAFDLHATEAADVNAAVRTAAPRASPLFKLGHFRWAMVHEVVNDILFAKPVAPATVSWKWYSKLS